MLYISRWERKAYSILKPRSRPLNHCSDSFHQFTSVVIDSRCQIIKLWAHKINDMLYFQVCYQYNNSPQSIKRILVGGAVIESVWFCAQGNKHLWSYYVSMTLNKYTKCQSPDIFQNGPRQQQRRRFSTSSTHQKLKC